MKRALVISSQVAASTVGANASAFCLRRLGVEAVVLPTILLGRHPGWGQPGGALTPFEILSDMWSGIDAQDLKFDAVLTGYMGTSQNVELAVSIIAQIKKTNPDCYTLVDPVMGDNGRLYVPVDVAEAIEANLLPLADIITPNVWELCHILKTDMSDLDELKRALRTSARTTLVTSAIHSNQIGGLLFESDGFAFAGHEIFKTVPHGGGDALAGTFLAHILSEETTSRAMQKSVSSIFAIMKHAFADQSPELPLIKYQSLLDDADIIKLQDIQ